jgi:isochorismate synthase
MRHPEWQAVVDIGGYAIEPNPPVSEWARIVEDALDRIDRQEIDKVVLARSVVVHSETPPSILRMFRSLVESYPQCYNFAWKSGDAVFMGASPELLAKVAGRHFHSNPLAGSAPRGEGLVSDEAIGNELLHSKKDLREHALVVEDLKANLEGLTESLTMAAAPSLKKMASVQHLSTEIRGLLTEGNGLLDVVEAVHPTPAVGGSPTIGAIAAIDALETIERGWYTGGVGWVDANGDGTVALALRCGLIRGVSTHLFAGAGIVEGSRPDDELDETRLKLEPLMRLLTAT